MDLFSMFLKIV